MDLAEAPDLDDCHASSVADGRHALIDQPQVTGIHRMVDAGYATASSVSAGDRRRPVTVE